MKKVGYLIKDGEKIDIVAEKPKDETKLLPKSLIKMKGVSPEILKGDDIIVFPNIECAGWFAKGQKIGEKEGYAKALEDVEKKSGGFRRAITNNEYAMIIMKDEWEELKKRGGLK